MRYSLSETTNILGKFATEDTVTISLYDISDGSVVDLDDDSCTEISTTGIFKWNTSNITTPPTEAIEYLWIMDNGTYKQYGKISIGGYPNDIEELYKLQGLKLGSPMTVTPTSRVMDDISLAITGNGETTTTVTRE